MKNESRQAPEVQVDLENLYREEVFTDLQAASVRRLSPVGEDGKDDPGRPVLYIGETTLMTQMGSLPVQFRIPAKSLHEAFQRFPDGVNEAVRQLTDQAREMAREEASRIVVPSAVPPGLKGNDPRGGQGGVPGGGKLILK